MISVGFILVGLTHIYCHRLCCFTISVFLLMMIKCEVVVESDFISWCNLLFLDINVKKTKEMMIFR